MDAELIALTENLQREDLRYFQEAEYLQAYLMHSGLTQAQAAKRLGRSQSAIANNLRLLQHTPKVRAALMEHNLSERHARELLRVHGEDQRLAVIEELSRRNFSVAQTARYIDTLETQSAISGSARYRRRKPGWCWNGWQGMRRCCGWPVCPHRFSDRIPRMRSS